MSTIERRLGWAWIGSSGWATERFAPAVVAAGGKIIGAFGSSVEKSNAFAEKFDARPFTSVEALLSDDDVDIVWIASPTGMHEQHVMLAAGSGKILLIEKPLSPDFASAQRVADVLQVRNARAVLAFQQRFNPGIQRVAAVLASDTLGKITSATLLHSSPQPRLPVGWRSDASHGGWAIGDIGSHLLDIAVHLFGELTFVSSVLGSPGAGLAVDDVALLTLLAGEHPVTVQASTAATAAPSLLQVEGTKGWLRLSDFWSGGGTLHVSGHVEVRVSKRDPYIAQIEAVSALARHGSSWTGSQVRDGVAVAEIMTSATAYRALRDC